MRLVFDTLISAAVASALSAAAWSAIGTTSNLLLIVLFAPIVILLVGLFLTGAVFGITMALSAGRYGLVLGPILVAAAVSLRLALAGS
ncbi:MULTISPECIES: hypothetical protein [unclassified Bradyrhizobium]|uniref:hypothetical protein n=1 Tax=unclassified Bradyrhizobium TaxID=2631580 RepID=UPI002342A4A3|nr:MULTISPECIES: hypothetical protein [unclassified Bradyrhizobium]GLH86755.1 hypothetical protein SSBR45R_42150 [Bradyrhizobium sp. SSBR45R]